MKVKIGPYKDYFGPYQLADRIVFWNKDSDLSTKLGEAISNTFIGNSLLWLDSKRKRSVKVRIDKYDTWNMDETLAYIIVPMLKKLVDDKQGCPMVDPEDAPENLRWTEDDPDYEVIKKAWEWVLGEMLFAFESKLIDWEDQFHTGNVDVKWVPVDKDGNVVSEDDKEYWSMEKGPNDTHKFDKDGYMEYSKRMENGFKLFGKYYNSLWT